MDRFKVLSTKRLNPTLVQQAGEAGVEVLEREFISVEPIVSDEVYQQLKPWLHRAEPTYAVFTSANGVEAVKPYLQKEGVTSLPHWKVFCISGKTKEALAATLPGTEILATAEYGAVLAQHIIAQGDVQEVVFFCGNKRREELPTLLQAAGITVHEIVVYRTEETPRKVEEDFDAVLFFSPSGVSSFFAVNQLKKDAVCFAIGRTTAEAVAAFTNNQIITPATTSPEAMLEAVQHYVHTINCKK